ncbi:protein phosphatase Slingshot homolog 1-like isoform X1 [Salvelinus fontinalis]|uniref:protein phosphatase Slingshot homolog 1-like isoform X1 n=2 Tax=Salvelinus fontinalis TaxID=8038 RepID=UPI002485B46B|nr:protein phosphatase Slingshot homolog 1-like isoform X1 [Salvelinus fontinalis]
MALVTLQRSPTPSAASTASTATTNAGEDFGSDDDRRANQSLSESFFMVKGAALFLQQGTNAQGPKTPTHHKLAGDLPQHLQVMINTLRSEDRIKLAVRLESGWSDRVRYMVVVYTSGRQDTEENILLGMDFTDKDSKSCSIGMVLPLWSDTKIHLDGDGGFSVTTGGRSHVFKPVSVQAMWSALQILHKACEVSRRYNYFPGGMALTWMGFYESCITSEQSCINEWNAMTDLETTRPDSPAMFVDRPTESERTECAIKAKLRSIMMFRDLENVTSKEIRVELEQHMSCNLKEYKEFIDNEMLLILGQMDKATLIFDHLYLGSEWNASNLEELRDCGVGHILNVTREIDNFFPGTFTYHNIRVYDEEATDLLAHWNETYNFIVRAKKNQSKCLVHCKMGVSRSASTVIAYAMKEYGWTLEKAYNFVKQKRSIARPNAGFMRQLAEYEGILDASKQRHNKLWRPEGGEDNPDEASGQCCGGEETPVEGEAWGGEGCGASPCRGLGLEVEPLDPLNYNYYFRRLSDTALDSEPSTPVRGPPLLGMERVFIEIEDVERDALLEDEGFPMAQLALPGEGTAAQTCGGRLEPLEDMRLRLEFSTVEEEDEEEAQKEEAEMAALAWTPAGGEGAREDEERKEQVNMNRFNNENANNSNRLAAKRSCPATFDDSASTGNPYKVKPSYQSCKDCLRLPPGRRCERPAGGRNHRLNPTRHCGVVPTISIDPPGTHFTNTPAPHSPCTLPATIARLEAYRQRLVSPMSCEELPRDRHCSLETEDMDELQEDEEEEEEQEPRPGREVGTGAITELTFMKLSLDGERPTGQSPSAGVELQTAGVELQPAGGGVELQRTGPELGMGLVRQRAEQLERLSGLAMEGPLSGTGLAEQMDLHLAVEEMEVDVGMHSEIPIPSTSCTVTAADPQMNTTLVSYPQGSAQTWTPVSSPHGSTLTRSSSSDSLHSNRGGHQGLVRQRTQEIETRMRLAGLTFPSLLKRSSSLAKLGGLTFSTEDLSDLADDQAQLFSTEPPACPSTPGGEEPSEPPSTPRS